MTEAIYLLVFAVATAATVVSAKRYNRRQRQAQERRWKALADKITNDVDPLLAAPGNLRPNGGRPPGHVAWTCSTPAEELPRMVPTQAEWRAHLPALLVVRCELATVLRDGEFVNWCTSHDCPATHTYPSHRPASAPNTA